VCRGRARRLAELSRPALEDGALVTSWMPVVAVWPGVSTHQRLCCCVQKVGSAQALRARGGAWRTAGGLTGGMGGRACFCASRGDCQGVLPRRWEGEEGRDGPGVLREPFGLAGKVGETRGSECPASLGFGAESLWDSWGGGWRAEGGMRRGRPGRPAGPAPRVWKGRRDWRAPAGGQGRLKSGGDRR